MDYGRPALADRLAAEYAAGLLRGAARRRFERLLPAHPGLREATRRWQERLMPLSVSVAPVAPSASVWKRIEARIEGRVAAGGDPAAGAAATASAWWQRLAFWRGLSAATGLAAVGFAAVLAVATSGPVRPPIVVVLAPAAGEAAVPGPAGASIVASISADGRALVTQPIVGVSLQAGRALELWSLPAQGAPRSLGLIAADQATVVRRGQVLDGTTGFAVSLEPAGGSPTGAPTGPVLYVGKLTL